MGKVVMPKNSAVEEEIKAALKIYYDENDWLKNDVFTQRLKDIIGGEQYHSSYTKKVQMTSYYGFTIWENFSNPQSRRKITPSGRRFYEAWMSNNKEKMLDEVMYSLENTIFGRNNCGCSDSDSDVEIPSIFIRTVLEMGYLIYNEFAYLLWQMEDCGVNYTDAVMALKEVRNAGNLVLTDEAKRYTDAKPIMMLIRWGFLAEDGKIGASTKIVIAENVLERYGERLKQLKIYNVDKFSGGTNEMTEYIAPVYRTNVETEFDERNRIVFGAPGTGKSHKLKKDSHKLLDSNMENLERVTFHPDYSYAQFVGTYKPVTDMNGDIRYSFVPGPFMRVFVEAIRSGRTNPKKHLLLIEEINRAKVAAVFGDVFQLLDRDDYGVSEYEIQTSEDIRKYLASKLGGTPDNWKKIKLPDNMFIWATMNSADQGVFPMDTAFKRRWSFEYLGINENEEEITGKIILGGDEEPVVWNRLRKAINEKLAKDYKVNEDKLMGPFFLSKKVIKTDETGMIADSKKFIDTFKSKVIMYLYEDAAKQHKHKLFNGCDSSKYSSVCDAFDKIGMGIFGEDFKANYYDQQEG